MDRMTKDKDFNLERLKEEYAGFKEKYNLPEFSELNKLFDIEEVEVETDFLLRKIRRVVSERIGAYSRFIEIILNPSNAPMFFFKLVKKLDSKDKEILGEIYEVLGDIEVATITLDLDYDEKKEAEFIGKMFHVFNDEIKEKFLKTIERLSGVNDNSKKYNGSYFG
jgi:hypothetical protein